ncbi:MAG: hypothetical protein ABSE89_05695 [Sedimentisphaerales bacterium]
MNKTISVLEPINEAIERAKIILFRPFNLEKWMIIGFCAWLANLVQGSGGGGFNFKDKEDFSKVIDFCKANMLIVIPIAAAATILFICVILVLLWLGSRGKFMFLDCLAKNKAHIIEPWKAFKKQANGLLGFRLLLMATALLWVIALGVLTIWLVSLAKLSNAGIVIIGIIICAMIILFIIVSLFFGFIQVLTFDFVMPIMYLQRTGISASWAKIGHLLWQNFWKIVLYLLFKILIVLCIWAIVVGITFISCCCLCGIGIILFIPYIGTVIFLPLWSFHRLYSLCYLRQFGAEYDVFTAAQ